MAHVSFNIHHSLRKCLCYRYTDFTSLSKEIDCVENTRGNILEILMYSNNALEKIVCVWSQLVYLNENVLQLKKRSLPHICGSTQLTDAFMKKVVVWLPESFHFHNGVLSGDSCEVSLPYSEASAGRSDACSEPSLTRICEPTANGPGFAYAGPAYATGFYLK